MNDTADFCDQYYGEKVALRKALLTLVEKLTLVGASPSFQSVFTLAHVHGVPYGGPNWQEELQEAVKVLSEVSDD